MNPYFPDLHIRKHSIRYALAAGLLTIVLFFAVSSRANWPAPHDFVSGFQQSIDSEELTTEEGIGEAILNSTLGFQKLLAINLPERSDHRDRFILQCAFSDMEVEFVDGVHGDTVADKALPANHASLGATEIGSWRAHINAIEQVVHEDLGSALIMEDDVDWDIRIKALLQNFALSATALVTSPTEELYYNDISTNPPTISPYGGDWDMLWLGHCGSSLPGRRIIQVDDDSVPEPHYLHSWNPNEVTPLSIFPNHTRVVMQNAVHVCSLAYAVSQKGARKLLYELGISKLNGPFDLMLRDWCSRSEFICLSVLPQLFDHHRVKGPMSLDSDIRLKEGERDEAFTLNVRMSVAMNMPKLLIGSTDYDDQYPDTV